MGAWSVAILDSGIVDEFEAVHGPNAFEWDFYHGNADTDGWRTDSHGTRVALTLEQTNPALERIDMQIASNLDTDCSVVAADAALNWLIGLTGEGWKIGAINLSWGGAVASSAYSAEIAALAARGVFAVAASGNSGTHAGLETPLYPAAWSNVIAVGSHDGAGVPSRFSNNDPGSIAVLADGEDVPAEGLSGTSFSAPQVAAGVATVQALADAALERSLGYDEVVDVLRQGGAAPLSHPDPADGTTRYFLFDQGGSLSYFQSAYLDPEFSAREYIASHGDIEALYGTDPGAARSHFLDTGVYEGRMVGFDGLAYVASHGDLITALGADREAGAGHYLTTGRDEGRGTDFDARAYLDASADLVAAFGDDVAAATRHYITSGITEGRPTHVPPAPPAVSESGSDLPATTDTPGWLAVGQSAVGTITLDDRDWFRTELTAGETVVIEARGSGGGGGTLYDPELRLHDGSGDQLTYDWDSGADKDARLAYTPTATGAYFIEVDGFLTHTGTYTVSVAAAAGGEAEPEDDQPVCGHHGMHAAPPAPRFADPLWD